MKTISILLSTFIFSATSFCCTGIIVKTQNGSTIAARTMEFGFDVQSKLIAIPKGIDIEFLSSSPDQKGLEMKTKYGFAGMNALGKNIVVDGVNENGLYLGCFYFNGFASYEELTKENQKNAISSEELGNYILGSFSTVDEVIEGLKKVTVVGTFIKEINASAPFHYAVSDASGRSIVIEYTEEGLKIFDNNVGVVCNNPTYDWHLVSIRNYVNLTPNNSKGFSIAGEDFAPLAEGTGMLGLPGDYTSTSRFVRATAFVQTALPSADEEEGVFRAFHILNAFDIPKGVVRNKVNETVHTDYTVWTSVVDTKNVTYYYNTYKNQEVQKLDIRDFLKQAKNKILVVESEQPSSYNVVKTK